MIIFFSLNYNKHVLLNLRTKLITTKKSNGTEIRLLSEILRDTPTQKINLQNSLEKKIYIPY